MPGDALPGELLDPDDPAPELLPPPDADGLVVLAVLLLLPPQAQKKATNVAIQIKVNRRRARPIRLLPIDDVLLYAVGWSVPGQGCTLVP